MRDAGQRFIGQPAIRALRLLCAMSLIGPAVLFAYTAWQSYRIEFSEARRELERNADVFREHALKVFETAQLLIAEIDTRLRAEETAGIRAEERRLHGELAGAIKSLPQFRDVWVIDAQGKPLASAMFYPTPAELDLSDRDYFAGTTQTDQTFVGEVVTGRTSSTRYFNIAGRRKGASGGDGGVVAVAVLPSYFAEVYQRMLGSPLGLAGLVRADGAFLARYPALPESDVRLTPQSGFMTSTARDAEQGFYETRSQLDGSDRLFAYRKLGRFPVYVYAARDRGAIVADWLQVIGSHLIFGVPATVGLFALTLLTLRSARSVEAEMRRRETAEAALLQAQKMEAIGRLTGGVAHDFNNLLTVIAGSLDRIAAVPTADPKHRKLVEAARRATDRAAALTGQLLAFARRQSLRPEILNLNGLLKEFRPLLRRAVGESVDLQFVFDPTLWPARVDRGQFEAAILNLVVNARDAMPQGGRITIETRNASVTSAEAGHIADIAAGDHVVVAVSDTGTGIAAEHLPRIFDPFFTTKEIGKGSGLGLSQVFGFVKQSGGGLDVPRELAVGTVISIYLPKEGSSGLLTAAPLRSAGDERDRTAAEG